MLPNEPFLSSPAAGLLFPLAQLCQALRATRSRLQKAALVNELFARLPDEDLALAARFLVAQPFAGYDARVLGIGPSAVLAVLAEQGPGQSADDLRRRLVELGDLCSLAHGAVPARAATVTLRALADAFAGMAAPDTKPEARRQKLAGLLRQATPEEASLIVGIATGELRVGFNVDALVHALARLAEVPLAQAARVHMLVGDVGEAALRLRRGEMEPPLRPFHAIHCMLASPFVLAGDKPLDFPTPFIAQDKYDGIRVQVHAGPHAPQQDAAQAAGGRATCVALQGVQVQGPQGPARLVLFSRTHDDVTHAFPDLHAPLLAALPHGAADGHTIVDGELLAIRDGQVLPFASLQARLGRKAPSMAVQEQAPAHFVAFDLLATSGALCIDEGWGERNERLAGRLAANARVLLAPSLSMASPEALGDAFDAARARGHEGLVLKHPAAPYTPGKRGKLWVKVKLPVATLDVVVISAEVGSGRKKKWLSDLTFAVRRSESDAALITLGKAYSGLTDADLERLTPWFVEHTTGVFAHGKVRTVTPNVVLEIAFDRVQASARHKSGFALRFARIVHVRWDKPVDEIDTLEAVRALAEAPHGPIER